MPRLLRILVPDWVVISLRWWRAFRHLRALDERLRQIDLDLQRGIKALHEMEAELRRKSLN